MIAVVSTAPCISLTGGGGFRDQQRRVHETMKNNITKTVLYSLHNARARAHTHTYTHTHTHTLTHTRTHTHARAHAHTHTYIHARTGPPGEQNECTGRRGEGAEAEKKKIHLTGSCKVELITLLRSPLELPQRAREQRYSEESCYLQLTSCLCQCDAK